MTEKTYRQAFEQAKKDLADAMARKTKAASQARTADEESIQLRRAVTALAMLCGENVEDSMGLTEAVRTAAPSKHYWTLKTFKEQVEWLGVSLGDLKNPDASVLSVLNRLVAAKEFITTTGRMGTPPVDVKIWRKVSSRPTGVTTDDDIQFDGDIPF